MTEVLSFSRSFQLWEYTAGHSQLLLCSPRSNTNPTTVDVLFKNVAAIQLQTFFEGLSISEAFEEQKQNTAIRLGVPKLESQRVFIVHSNNATGFVIAGALAWHEDQRNYNEISYFFVKPD